MEMLGDAGSFFSRRVANTAKRGGEKSFAPVGALSRMANRGFRQKIADLLAGRSE